MVADIHIGPALAHQLKGRGEALQVVTGERHPIVQASGFAVADQEHHRATRVRLFDDQVQRLAALRTIDQTQDSPHLRRRMTVLPFLWLPDFPVSQHRLLGTRLHLRAFLSGEDEFPSAVGVRRRRSWLGASQ